MSSYGIHFSVSLVEYDIFVVSVMKDLVTMASIFILMPVFNKVRYVFFHSISLYLHFIPILLFFFF